MSEGVITLQNGADAPQHVFDATGHRFTIGSNEVLPFPETVARLFLKERAQYVSVYQPIAIPPSKPGEAIVYMANVTGSPFLPEEVTLKVHDKRTGIEQIQHIPNPLRKPIPVQRFYARSQELVETRGGTMTTMSHPPILVKIPPFWRIPVPESVADWLERRDIQQDERMVGAVVKCRAPSAWEPNDSWELPEILAYAEMVDQKADKWVDFQSMWKAVDRANATELTDLKIKLLQVLFYRLIDDRYALPTRVQFEAYIKRVESEMRKTAKQGQQNQPRA